MATIREIAKEAHVSPSTVSRVLNNNAPVFAATRQAVLDAVKRLDYSHEAKKHTIKKSGHVNIIIPQNTSSEISEHPEIYTIMSSFVNVMNKNSITSSVTVIDKVDAQHAHDLFTDPADGYLIMGTNIEQEDFVISYLEERKIPFITMNRWLKQRHYNYVNIDDIAASQYAVEYLLKAGHRKIAFVGGNRDFRVTQLRYQGYLQALKEAGLEADAAYAFFGEYTPASGCNAAEWIHSLAEKPTAAFFTSDVLAINAQRQLRERGYRMPEELSIVGYGDISISAYVQPALTTISVPAADMGKQAALAMLNLLQNEHVMNIRIQMKADLILRDSVAFL